MTSGAAKSANQDDKMKQKGTKTLEESTMANVFAQEAEPRSAGHDGLIGFHWYIQHASTAGARSCSVAMPVDHAGLSFNAK